MTMIYFEVQSQSFDILEQTHRDEVEDEIDKVIENYKQFWSLLYQDKDEDFDINSYLEESFNQRGI